MTKKVIAIIPARGGSKRLPGKNIMPMMGKPMIAWTIDAAVKSGIFTDVFVTTDSEEVARIAKDCGAAVPFLRDPKDADDHTPVGVATINALIKMEQHRAIEYDTVVQLMPNCPCRTEVDIKSAYDHFCSTGACFQISVFKFGWMNPWWAMRLKDGQSPSPLFPEAYSKRSQDMEELYCPTGAIWIADGPSLKQEKTFYGNKYQVFPLGWQSAVDIDDQEDLRMAQVIFMMNRDQ